MLDRENILHLRDQKNVKQWECARCLTNAPPEVESLFRSVINQMRNNENFRATWLIEFETMRIFLLSHACLTREVGLFYISVTNWVRDNENMLAVWPIECETMRICLRCDQLNARQWEYAPSVTQTFGTSSMLWHFPACVYLCQHFPDVPAITRHALLSKWGE
jgi:hypothetical protein